MMKRDWDLIRAILLRMERGNAEERAPHPRSLRYTPA